MKIRQGFISNSSSTSFVVHKMYLTEEQKELLRLLPKQEDANIRECGEYFVGEYDSYKKDRIVSFLIEHNFPVDKDKLVMINDEYFPEIIWNGKGWEEIKYES